MKSVKLVHGKIILTDMPEPKIASPEDVKIKIAFSSICGYELNVYTGKIPGINVENIGHEASGIITDIGRQVDDLHIGDKVSLNPYYYCGGCESCRKGLRRFCTNQEMDPHSYMAEYVILNQRQVYRLPDELSLKEACLIEPLSVAIRAVEKADLGYNKKLLIIGGGAMGLLALQTATKYPVDGIAVLDPNENKRTLAKQLGASMALNPKVDDLYYNLMDFTQGLGFDSIIEASGSSECVESTFNLLARGGSLVLLSMYEVDFQLPISALNLYWKDATIQAVYPSVDSFSQALHLAPRLDLNAVITGVYPYYQAADAFKAKSSQHDHAKVILNFIT